MDKNGHFSSQPKTIIPSLTSGSSEMPSILADGTLHLHLRFGLQFLGLAHTCHWAIGVELFAPPFFHGSS